MTHLAQANVASSACATFARARPLAVVAVLAMLTAALFIADLLPAMPQAASAGTRPLVTAAARPQGQTVSVAGTDTSAPDAAAVFAGRQAGGPCIVMRSPIDPCFPSSSYGDCCVGYRTER